MPMPDLPEQGLAPEGVTFDEVLNVIEQWCGEVVSEILPPPELLPMPATLPPGHPLLSTLPWGDECTETVSDLLKEL